MNASFMSSGDDCAPTPNVDRVPANLAKAYEHEDFVDLVARIQAGDRQATEALYRRLSPGLRRILHRQLQLQDIEDRVHDTLVIVVEAIQRGEVRDHSRLPAFMLTVAKRETIKTIRQISNARTNALGLDNPEVESQTNNPGSSPEVLAIEAQRVAIMRDMLTRMDPMEREVLTRFYVGEEPAQEICAALKISPGTYRCIKSRAKQRFGELARRTMVRGAFA